jgi:hypothetical protein
MAGDRTTGGGRGGKPHLRADRRDVERPRSEDLPIPDSVEFSQLDSGVRQRLRTLSKMNAEDVGRHLIMVGLLLEDDPELAYRHAMVAVARAGRVDVVREAAALAAYSTGRYADALRELRTVRRLSGSNDHLAAEADCERGLGRPERAIALARSPEASTLKGIPLGPAAAALHTLERIATDSADTNARVAEAKIDVLRALGRDADADAIAATLPQWEDDEDEVIVYDAQDDEPEEPSR